MITGSLKNHTHNIKDLTLQSSLGRSGHIHLPGGLLLQWGLSESTPQWNRKITFPKPFKEVFVAVCNKADIWLQHTHWSPDNGFQIYNLKNDSFYVGNIERQCMWIAIGLG